MKTIAVGEFKAKCLAYLEDVRSSHKTFIITKRGEEIAELRPISKKKTKQKRNPKLGYVIYQGDVVSPTGEEWDMDQ